MYKNLNLIQIKDLREIERISEEKIIDELLHIFEEQIGVFLKSADSMMVDKKFNDISKEAHKLKSSAGNLGLKNLFEIFLKLETSSKYQNQDEVIKIINQIPIEFSDSINLLRKYLSS